MDINRELNSLLSKYGVDLLKSDEEEQKIKLAEKYINEIFDAYGEKQVCVYGAGIHTVRLIKTLSECNKKKIKFIVGEQQAKELDKIYNFINTKEINLTKKVANVIVISSFSAANEIQARLEKMKCPITIINIYTELRKRGIDFSSAYYYRKPCTIVDIIKEKANLENAQDDERDYLFRKVISMYFKIKDIKHGLEFCNEYIESKGIYSEKYVEFVTEIKKLLTKIKFKMKLRNQQDIVINWVDALRYDEIEKTSYLNSVRKNSVFFENAYTLNPATSVALEVFMNGYNKMSDFKNGLNKEFSSEKTKFLKKLEERGYEFKYIGVTRMETSFQNKMRSNISDYYERKNEAPMTEIQWEALNCIINSDKPICCLIHQIAETHTPYMCTEINRDECEIWEDLDNISERQFDIERTLKNIENIQVKKAREYMDSQLQWYAEFYSDNLTKIYMSDHGKFSNYKFKSGWLHIMMMVQDKRYFPQTITELFGLNSMTELIDDVILGKTFDNVVEEYINIMFVPIYGMKFSEYIFNETLNVKKSCIQFVGITTAEDRYVQFEYGEEVYLRLEDENVNLINDARYQSRINELKDKMEKEHCCIDVSNSTYYEAARILNDNIGIKPGEKLFNDITDKEFDD